MNFSPKNLFNIIQFLCTMKTKKIKKEDPYKEDYFKKNTEKNTKVESNTSKHPENDKSPLPPNPNKVDNH